MNLGRINEKVLGINDKIERVMGKLEETKKGITRKNLKDISLLFEKRLKIIFDYYGKDLDDLGILYTENLAMEFTKMDAYVQLESDCLGYLNLSVELFWDEPGDTGIYFKFKEDEEKFNVSITLSSDEHYNKTLDEILTISSDEHGYELILLDILNAVDFVSEYIKKK